MVYAYTSFLLCFFSWFRRLNTILFCLSFCVALFDFLFCCNVCLVQIVRSTWVNYRFNQCKFISCNVCMVINQALRIYSEIHHIRCHRCWNCACVLCTFFSLIGWALFLGKKKFLVFGSILNKLLYLLSFPLNIEDHILSVRSTVKA